MMLMAAQVQVRSLKIQNRLDELARLGEWVGEISQELNLSPRAAFRLDLALAEAVTNVISYAAAEGQPMEILIRARLEDSSMDVDIVDTGLAFNPLDRPEPAAPSGIENAPVGGLGIQLMRKFVDQLSYTRTNGENILTLTLKDIHA